MRLLKKILSISILFCFILSLLLSIISYFINKKSNHPHAYPSTSGNTISILLLDGLSKTIFEENLQKGKLPNIQQLIAQGTYVKNGIGSFPSMTGYAFYPFITGEDATKSGIYGLRWFDRSLEKGNLRNYVGRTNIHMNRDIFPDPKNIFELSNGQYTCSINSYMNRGVKHTELTGWKHTTSKYGHQSLFKGLARIPFFGKKITADFFEHETYTMALAKEQLIKNPKVQWVTLPSLDAMHHIHGTTNQYAKLLLHVDSLVGDFIATIAQLEQSNTRGIALITDHGISDVHKNLDLRENFKNDLGLELERGKSVHLLTDKLNQPLKKFAEKDGYFVINGNLSAYLYFKDPTLKGSAEAWRKKLKFAQLATYPTAKGEINIVDYLSKTEGIGMLAVEQNDTTIWVQYKDKTAQIIKKEEKYKYQPIKKDPLGYSLDTAAIKLIDGQFHTADEWLAKTIKTNYPDAIYRLYELMSQSNVGDLIICSEKGYDLAADYELFVGNYKGGHGGLHKDLLNVPYLLYFPNTAPAKVNFARSEEVGKWIKNYLFKR